MTDQAPPEHLTRLLTDLQANEALAAGARAVVGEHQGRQAFEAAATYYQAQGYPVSVDELMALEIARKQASGEALTDDELDAVAGGSHNHVAQQLVELAMPIGMALTSDRRLKCAIQPVGRDTNSGLMIYDFAYLGRPNRRYRGVMADEVKQVRPSAVMTTPTGYLAVDYTQLGLAMIDITV
jgi:hypothetical protein